MKRKKKLTRKQIASDHAETSMRLIKGFLREQDGMITERQMYELIKLHILLAMDEYKKYSSKR